MNRYLKGIGLVAFAVGVCWRFAPNKDVHEEASEAYEHRRLSLSTSRTFDRSDFLGSSGTPGSRGRSRASRVSSRQSSSKSSKNSKSGDDDDTPTFPPPTAPIGTPPTGVTPTAPTGGTPTGVTPSAPNGGPPTGGPPTGVAPTVPTPFPFFMAPPVDPTGMPFMPFAVPTLPPDTPPPAAAPVSPTGAPFDLFPPSGGMPPVPPPTAPVPPPTTPVPPPTFAPVPPLPTLAPVPPPTLAPVPATLPPVPATLAPVPQAPPIPTAAPNSGSQPPPVSEFPPCFICGPGRVVSNSNEIIIPTVPPLEISCDSLQLKGFQGGIETNSCERMVEFLDDCGCRSIVPTSPTLPPFQAPPQVEPTPEPTPGPTPDPTPAPLAPTPSPVVITPAPVVPITPAPVVVETTLPTETAYPSPSPSMTPSVGRPSTPPPTLFFTTAPTETSAPSPSPSNSPTETQGPSETPTPTEVPSESPMPSPAPSDMPTRISPTLSAAPSSPPSESPEPSPAPSFFPTDTKSPSVSPAPTPSATPAPTSFRPAGTPRPTSVEADEIELPPFSVEASQETTVEQDAQILSETEAFLLSWFAATAAQGMGDAPESISLVQVAAGPGTEGFPLHFNATAVFPDGSTFPLAFDLMEAALSSPSYAALIEEILGFSIFDVVFNPTLAPVTASPVTASPVTASPVTASPVTASPVTAAPTPSPSGSARALTAIDEVASLRDMLSESVEVCSCVNCESDERCGGLWRGSAVGGDAKSFNSVHLVVSHCLHSLDWLEEFTAGFLVEGITIISKCGKEVEGIPKFAPTEVLRLENVGRCDHSYASWMGETLNNGKLLSDDSAFVFLKDDISAEHMHQVGSRRSLSELLRIASVQGFACGVEPGVLDTEDGNTISLSTYHDTESLSQFHLDDYSLGETIYGEVVSQEQFVSVFGSLGQWANSIGMDLDKQVVPVCYGGVFAVRSSRIQGMGEILSSIEKSLSRGNNIEEGHFMERMWANLLSNDLTQGQIFSLVQYSDGLAENGESYAGALAHSVSKGGGLDEWQFLAES